MAALMIQIKHRNNHFVCVCVFRPLIFLLQQQEQQQQKKRHKEIVHENE